MNINFIITLTEQEKELMTRQCIKEVEHCNKRVESLQKDMREVFEKTRLADWGTVMYGRCEMDRLKQKVNRNIQRKIAIYDIGMALCLGAEFMNFWNKSGCHAFVDNRIVDKRKPYYRKLAIYMMCRAGVITKDTRDRMLQLLKTKTPIQLQKRTQRKVNKLHEAFVEFNRKINGIVSHDEAKEIAKECGLHRYMVKKYGIEAVTSACCGTTEYTEPCGI